MASLFRSRALHTSARIAAEDTRKQTADFLARLSRTRETQSASASAASTTSAARSMIDSVGLRDSTDDRRRPFLPNKITQPHNFTSEDLYPDPETAPPRAKRPLVGPQKKVAKQIDPFFLRGENPLDHVTNPLMSYAFLNPMGMIKSRAQTGLTWKSQRRVGKMIRRARHMGIIPKWSNVPRPGGLGDRDFMRRT